MEGTKREEDNNLDSLFFDEWNDTVTDNKSGAKNTTWQNASTSSLFNNTINVNCSSNRLDISALCCDEELSGFDKNAGPTWIYPTNYPIRDYQFNIISNALFKNTLVSLPTGLGKTFIAAVVMYNFYRWYPLGKIVFTAPTRPLVAQQIEACYNITAIPQQDTVEMTGTMQVNARKIAWKQKRVFFATPQVVNNDLESGICPGELVRCLVIDEAHRAKGKHAYCQLVEGLTLKGHTLLRILALSATPGSKVEDVIMVVKNLHISHLELRSEQCIDVAMYSHSRKIETVVVPLGDELTNIRKQYVEIMDIYTRRLVQYRILNGNVSSLSKGKIIMLFKEFQNKEKSQRHPQHQRIMQDFTMAITLYHALELLTKHGARVFLNFFDERTDKQWVGKDDNLTCFLERLRDDLGVNPFTINRNTLPDGTIPEIEEDLKFGHPKFDHLKKVIWEHFEQAEKKGLQTKAIVFCEYRESVNLVHCLLLQCRPKIRPHVFIGQGAGSTGSGSKDSNLKAFSQKQQLKVMKMFRENICNVLVSTCIGEEGLDVGSVDLIICFDISNKSPIRLVQRCGRTGREREGRVVILVTEGREHQTLRDCILQRDSLNRRVMQSKELVKNLYSASPRMIPRHVKPKCQKMFITVQKPKQEEKPEKSGKIQGRIKDMFKKNSNIESEGAGSSTNVAITEGDLKDVYPNGLPTCSYIQNGVEHWNKSKDFFQNDVQSDEAEKKLKLTEWLEWQRTLQFTVNVDHSVDSEILSHILKLADSKRFDPPVVSQASYSSPPSDVFKTKSKTPTKANSKSPLKGKHKIINNDIRIMFQKLHKPTEDEIQKAAFDSKAKEILEDCGIKGDNGTKILEEDGITSAMIDLMVEINLELPKLERIKNGTYDSKCVFERESNSDDTPACLSPYFKLPSASVMTLSKIVNDIDLQEFERILKLQEYSINNKNKPKFDDSKKILDGKDDYKSLADIDFCDDSLLRINDREVIFDRSLPSCTKNINKSIENEKLDSEDIIDDDIRKAMMQNDFEIGDIDDLFEDTDDGNKENQLVHDKEIVSCNSHAENCDISVKIDDKLETNNDNSNKTNVNHDSESTEEYLLNEKVVITKDFDFGDIDDIFENTDEDNLVSDAKNKSHTNKTDSMVSNDKNKTDIKESNAEKTDNSISSHVPPVDPLKFFGLEDVEDLFANDDMDDDWGKNDKKSEKVVEEVPVEPPHSPILFSQRTSSRLKKLSLNHTTSTPLLSSQAKKQINLEPKSPSKFSQLFQRDISILSNNFLNKSNAKIKVPYNLNATKSDKNNVTLNKTDATSFTITQIIDLVNKEDKNKTCDSFRKNGITNNENNDDKYSKEDRNSSDESNHSVILCSQISKPVNKIKDFSSHKISVTILETSESSSDDDLIIVEPVEKEQTKQVKPSETSKSNFFKTNDIVSSNTKRKVVSSEDEFEASPFFSQKNKVASLVKRNKMSLREKIANSVTNGGKQSLSRRSTSVSPVKPLQTCSKNIGKENTNTSKQFTSPASSFRSQLTQFSKPKPSQWTLDCNQVGGHNLNVSNTISSEEEDDFKEKTPKRNMRTFRRKENRKKRCQFIDYEAALSGDSYEDSGDDDLEHSQNGSAAGDTSIEKFICDDEVEEHHQENGVDMEAKYLQSVRSPVKSHGQFKIPVMKPKKSNMSIFSQVDPDEHANYQLDSFCVDDHILSQRHEMTELEIAEAILKKRKRRKKKAASSNSPSPVKVVCTTNPADDSPIAANRKKRIIQQIDSESSTDDELFL